IPQPDTGRHPTSVTRRGPPQPPGRRGRPRPDRLARGPASLTVWPRPAAARSYAHLRATILRGRSRVEDDKRTEEGRNPTRAMPVSGETGWWRPRERVGVERFSRLRFSGKVSGKGAANRGTISGARA